MKHQKKVKKQAKTEWADVKSAGELKPGDRIRYTDFIEENVWNSIRDLVADLLRLCDREGVDARYVIDRAVKDWEYEREV